MFLRSFVKNNLLFRIMDPLKRKSPQSKTFFVYRHLRDVIHVSPRRFVHESRTLAFPTPPLQMKYFIL